jgi:hypothetical protein
MIYRRYRVPRPVPRSETYKTGAFSGRGQSTLETAMLLMLIFFAFLAMMVYIKRAVQGRVRNDADSIGQQYDFQRTASNMSTRRSSYVTTRTSTDEQAVMDPWTGMATDRLVTTQVAETHYDISNTTGREVVGRP